MAAVDNSLPGLLSTLIDSITSATSSFPTDADVLLPPPDGISLLDTKNELLLSYIQNLVFLIILKVRNSSQNVESAGEGLHAAVVKKLVELRVYMERGIRPLEGRLKYQIEKVLRAADDFERKKSPATNGTNMKPSNKSHADEALSGSGAEFSDPEVSNRPDDLSYRPNPAALLQKAGTATVPKTTPSQNPETYKPPRITPMAMPTNRDDVKPRQAQKSRLLNEYVSQELSAAPLAEPSIGSSGTILARGRNSLSARERERQRERIAYEEANFARLPSESKAEGRKARKGTRRNEYGGEDWTGLGDVGDRVARSVARSTKDGMGRWERRKRRRGREDGSNSGGIGGGGVGIGDAFENRRRILEGRQTKKMKRGR